LTPKTRSTSRKSTHSMLRTSCGEQC